MLPRLRGPLPVLGGRTDARSELGISDYEDWGLINIVQGEGRVNLDLIRQRAQEIRQATSQLQRYGNLPQDEFVADETVVDAAKYRLIVAIEAAISICTHLSARIAGGSPENYAQPFQVLASTGVISEELANRLGQMARFRNLLVHGYAEIDDAARRSKGLGRLLVRHLGRH